MQKTPYLNYNNNDNNNDVFVNTVTDHSKKPKHNSTLWRIFLHFRKTNRIFTTKLIENKQII